MSGYAALGQALGAIIGAGGQIYAAERGQADSSSGNQTFVGFDPTNVPLFAGSQNDALGLIGRANLTNEATPVDQLVNQIQGLAVNNKLKRRALHALKNIRESGVVNINDPAFERDVLTGLTRTKKVYDVPYAKELRGALARLGITDQELTDTLVQNQEFVARQRDLQERLQPLQEGTILNRARTAQTASQLLADAAGFASTGDPQSGLQSDLLNRVNRGIDDQEEAFLLRSNFGGFQPGAGIEAFERARTDAPVTALEQALASAAGLTAGLGGGLEFAQQGAGQAIGALQGAAGIAAQQAIAANQIRNSASINNANTIANGYGAGSAALGSGIANASLLQFGQGSGSNLYSGPAIGSSTNNLYQPNFDTGFNSQ